MKKVNRIYINKKWQKALGIICLLGLILTSVVFLTDSSQEKKEVSAHPTNTISLGNIADDNIFELPTDATKIKESGLPAQFNSGYVQGEDIIPIADKSNVTAYGSNNVNNGVVPWNINDIKETIGGNYLVLFGAGGTNRGGIIKVSIFNKSGDEIATKTMGTLENAVLRVGTKFYEVANNRFLLSTSGDRYFRCTVSNETINSADIAINELHTSGNKQQLKVHESRKVDTDQRINHSPIITGPVYPQYVNEEGIIRGRIPIGTMDTQGWETGNPTANLQYEYSLANLLFSDIGYSEGNQESIHPYLFMNDNQIIYGTIVYWDGTGTKQYQTVEIFSQENVNVNGVNLKKRKYIFHDENENRGLKIQILKEISNTEYVHFFNYTATETQLYQVDLNTFEDKIIRRFPPETRLLISDNGDGTLSYCGSTKSLTGEFNSAYYTSMLNSPYYYVQGVMDGFTSATPAKVRSIRAMELNNWLLPNNLLTIDTNKFFIGGQLLDYHTFADQSYVVSADGSVTTGIPRNSGAFLGISTILDDYSPIINQDKRSIVIDITNDRVRNPIDSGYKGWDTLDRWLITGKAEGLVTTDEAIKVYDHFDSNDTQIGATAAEREEWLQKRINRNPKDLSAEIEWEKLGFDKNKAGPQLVTYFVTDSQSQPAVTSRWVNALGEETKTDDEDKFALDVQNFHIPIEEVTKPTFNEEAIKKLAKTLAWNLTNNESSTGDHGNGLDEDGAAEKFSTTKVEVNATQLAALQAATVAKPYPVDITYKPEAGIEITNRVWVFVTTDNTVANTETGVVYYADDYTIPYRSRGDHDLEAILTHGNVKAYNYYAKDTTAELAALPNSTSGTSNWSISNHNVIQDPFSGGPVTLPLTVKPELTYTWNAATDHYHTNGETTEGSLDVTLTGNVLLHVRQVIQTPTDGIVVPTEGYLTLQTILNNGGNPALDPDYQSQMTISSGKQADNPNFSTWGVDIEQLADGADQVKLTPIIPEFYQYNGYYASNEKASHNDNSLNTPNNIVLTQSYLYEEGELWITLYLEPNGTNNGKPQPYSWD
ncbi:hypothetical protein, partial [Enterococcus pallens]